MSNKDTLDAFMSIVQDKIVNFSDTTGKPGLAVLKGEMQEKFDALVKSQGYVTAQDYQMLETLAAKLEVRIDNLEKKLAEREAK
jgi:hypothetical protein